MGVQERDRGREKVTEKKLTNEGRGGVGGQRERKRDSAKAEST